MLNPYTLSGIGGILVTAVLFAGFNTCFQSIIDRKQYQFSERARDRLKTKISGGVHNSNTQEHAIKMAMHTNYIEAYKKQMENKPLYLSKLFVLSFAGSASFGATNLLVSLGTGSALVGNVFLACFTTIPIGLAAAFPRQATEASESTQNVMLIMSASQRALGEKDLKGIELMQIYPNSPRPSKDINPTPTLDSSTVVQQQKSRSNDAHHSPVAPGGPG